MKELFLITVFVVAGILGYKVIKEVPSLLHTPLMSGTNAISGVTILGSLVSTAFAVSLSSKLLGFIAIVLAAINLIGGFLVTDRMLKMFKS
ncbi:MULTISPECIES: NAD(P) transhydrogenase subunit alpha [Tepidanaerobacter]|uniref:proton-translocating NAD(P)(+) transhydrogenase n=1 Tax=Tepidanaerobacter syntrophicus TaxID=224999 RepID=A0A0U9HE64_9FIRM|nr:MULTISPECIES: NAD(P) transhydrogenase subunit alpha [Tepidanaerobacter]GAQ25109.1 NAD(P) transhydrogenase subunit alpha [Tepidanaerobacter syntrophicus]GLI18596.1 pyridine nucleotide transhydrogenase subunit alpha [Tepidanaerobacter syntrophicus]GLI50663.1 pyridine nucleotide transhydrogenase subunit alpha [Tepidanaerobacter syntrophicus]HHV82868.1 NAD(P) transhydrogenase subunit alpha [Tepidanaerobacter syntrophicus]